jgi:xanthine/CO dehydrogenase XdhC/CoxF family maturation factor
MDEAILTALSTQQESGGAAVLVTIIATRGSTPRKAGSKMLVCADGKTVGTIGGGCAEAEIKLQALLAMDMKRSFIYTVNMLDDVAGAEGMVCGGVLDAFIQYL